MRTKTLAARSPDDLLPPSPPAEKATARQDQAGIRPTRLRCLKQKRADVEGQHACKLIGDLSSDEPTTATARQGEKATARCDQTRQSRTDDGARDTEGKQLGSDLSGGVHGRVDVEIGHAV